MSTEDVINISNYRDVKLYTFFQIDEVRKKEGLKVVEFDLCKIRELIEQSRQEKDD